MQDPLKLRAALFLACWKLTGGRDLEETIDLYEYYYDHSWDELEKLLKVDPDLLNKLR